MTAIVFGYYNKYNLGDEQYKLTFPVFLKRCGFRGQVKFINPHELDDCYLPSDTQMLILGGGDVINDWFFKKLDKITPNFRGPIFALSIGITYPSTITKRYLERFDMVVLRHSDLMDDVARVIGPGCVACVPDFGFLLREQEPVKFTKKRVGVFAARGIETESVRAALATLDPAEYDIVLYSMNTSTESHEGDVFANETIGIGRSGPVIKNVDQMLSHIGGCYITICVRYHAHVFSIIQSTPFVSFAYTPKTQYLMRDFGFANNVADTRQELIDKLKWTLANRDTVRDQIRKAKREIDNAIGTFKLDLVHRTTETIASECKEMMADGVDTEDVVSHALYHTTGQFDNKYRYGFIQNIKLKLHDMHEMVKWIHDDAKQEEQFARGFKFLQRATDFSGVHRSGWEAVSKMLRAFENPKGILTDLYVDATFHWNCKNLVAQGILPFRQQWIGFLHHTPSTEFSAHNASRLFDNAVFLQSLKRCKMLVCLSESLSKWTIAQLRARGFTSVRVETMRHPTEHCQKRFHIRKWLECPTVTQVGAWLRNSYAIYELRLTWGKKQVLIGRKMEAYQHPKSWYLANRKYCRCDVIRIKRVDGSCSSSSSSCSSICRPPEDAEPRETIMTKFMTRYCHEKGAPLSLEVRQGERCCPESAKWHTKHSEKITAIRNLLQSNYETVHELTAKSNDDYDDLLQTTVVFLNMTDCSAANTIIECMIRDTPLIVNRLPAVEEYLGVDYPLYYKNMADVWRHVNPASILAAHEFLQKRDKYDLGFDSFMKHSERLLCEISQPEKTKYVRNEI